MFVLSNTDFKSSLVALTFGWFNLIPHCLLANSSNKSPNISSYNLSMSSLISGTIGISVQRQRPWYGGCQSSLISFPWRPPQIEQTRSSSADQLCVCLTPISFSDFLTPSTAKCEYSVLTRFSIERLNFPCSNLNIPLITPSFFIVLRASTTPSPLANELIMELLKRCSKVDILPHKRDENVFPLHG